MNFYQPLTVAEAEILIAALRREAERVRALYGDDGRFQLVNSTDFLTPCDRDPSIVDLPVILTPKSACEIAELWERQLGTLSTSPIVRFMFEDLRDGRL